MIDKNIDFRPGVHSHILNKSLFKTFEFISVFGNNEFFEFLCYIK